MRSSHNLAIRSKPYPCDYCPENYINDRELNFHLQSVHGVDLAEVYDTGDADEQPLEENEDEDYEQYLLDNAEGGGMQPHHQGEDSEVLDPTSFLEQSISVAGQDQNDEYLCEVCNKMFPTRQKFLYHRYYHIREAKYGCDNCPEKFKLR